MESQPIFDRKDLSPLNIKSFEPFDSNSPDNSPGPKSASPDSVPLYIKFVETNRLKIKSKEEIEGHKGGAIRLIKREHMFYVPLEKIAYSKFLKNNYLPEDNMIEAPLAVNTSIPFPSFKVIQLVIEALVEKQKSGLGEYPLELSKNTVEIFAAACILELDDLAATVYETKIKDILNLKLLIGMLLMALEYNLPQVYFDLYKRFREYIVYINSLTSEASQTLKKLLEAKNDGTRVEYKKDLICVYFKDRLEFGFPSEALKKPFEMYRKEIYLRYFKPEQKYFVFSMKKTRNHPTENNPSSFPRQYCMMNQHTKETIITGVQQTEDDEFNIFGIQESNNMLYGNNYVGRVEIVNAWATAFNIYDDGIDEEGLKVLPKYICAPRTKIAAIVYKPNIQGESLKQFQVTFIDFAERKSAQLIPQPPKFDAKNNCYTLDFYGKANLASKKNFILTTPHDQDNIILMQGKAAKDEFNLDFRHPLNFIQAFGISLASMAKKISIS